MVTTPLASDLAFDREPGGEMRGQSDSEARAWFAAYTAPRHEKFVQSQLNAKQIESFLPTVKVVRRWNNGVRREVDHPLFPSYIFVHLGPGDRLPVVQTSGVVYIVGNGTSLLPLDENEMLALRIGEQRGTLMPHPPVSDGDVVCITRGPFRGVKGCVQQQDGDLSLVVNIQLIQKFFAIRVDANDVELDVDSRGAAFHGQTQRSPLSLG